MTSIERNTGPPGFEPRSTEPESVMIASTPWAFSIATCRIISKFIDEIKDRYNVIVYFLL